MDDKLNYRRFWDDATSTPEFQFIDPPFQLNAKSVTPYPPEVSGNHLLRVMAQRLGWASFRGKKLLDFGCGVRLARTIVNLGIEVDLYAGIDVNKEAIDWLKINCPAPRFRFEHLNVQNPLYSQGGPRLDEYPLFASLAGIDFDVACMFSVITHQVPDDARKILSFLHRTMGSAGRLYFTAFLDEETDTYREAAPDQIAAMSTYNPDYLCRIVAETGWKIERIYARTKFQQQTFVARKG